jgi:hypothetical protein
MIVKYDLEGMWGKMGYLNVLSQHVPGGTEESYEEF